MVPFFGTNPSEILKGHRISTIERPTMSTKGGMNAHHQAEVAA